MRRYEISITDQDGKPKIVTGPNGIQLFNGTFTSTDASDNTIPGALHIEIDAPVSVYNSPLGGASLAVYGIGLPLLSQAADFNPSIDRTKYCNIRISAGMAKGLPLANPDQYGVILQSRIEQSFGNWQDTSQTLNFIMVQPEGPLNFSFKCPNNGFLGDAIRTTLTNVFPTATININISDRLVLPEEMSTSYYTLSEFTRAMYSRSKSIYNDANYPGIQISNNNNIIEVYDFTVKSTDNPIQIQFEDLIGQPTWLSPGVLTFKTIMRYDVKIGSEIIMPTQSNASGNRGLVVTTPESYSQYKSTVVFSGTFKVQLIRHLGSFRQPDANCWVTLFQVYKPTI
jgi:hypothetical protein